MQMSELIRFFLLPVYKPKSGIRELLGHGKKIVYAVLIFLFLGIIYTFSVQLAYMKGLGASVEPFVKIAAEDYYYWQRFYQIPFFFLTSILFAGIVRLLAIPFAGSGSYEDHFCLFAVAQTFPMFLTMWIPETIYFVFYDETSVMPVWFDLSRQILGILWPLVIMVMGISVSEKIKWYYALIITFIAAVPVTAMMVIFIR